MRAELVLMGRRVDMARQARRRGLVVVIYAGLVMVMVLCCRIDQWKTTGFYLVLGTVLINRLFLGGYYRGGLLKPFNGRGPRQTAEMSPLMPLRLRFGLYRPEPDAGEYRNDERELHQRDRAHYYGYQTLTVALLLLWLLTGWHLHAPRLLEWMPWPADLVIYGMVLSAVLLSQVLPQSLILWTEPDMAAD